VLPDVPDRSSRFAHPFGASVNFIRVMSLKIYYANGLVFELPQLALWALMALILIVALSVLWATSAATHVVHIHLPGTESDDEEDEVAVVPMAQPVSHSRSSSSSFAPVVVIGLNNRSPPHSPVATAFVQPVRRFSSDN
jgi:hypothetical protein